LILKNNIKEKEYKVVYTSKTTENDSSMNGIVENRYRNGKIYKIVCNITGLTYYGSTCEPTLARRLAKHRGCYNRWLKSDANQFIIDHKS
jgi:hypothetical protein